MAKSKIVKETVESTGNAHRFSDSGKWSPEVEKRLAELEIEQEARKRVGRLILIILSFCGAGVTFLTALVQLILSIANGR